jgi:hypothetical protein
MHIARHRLPDEDDVAVGIGRLVSLSVERDTWVVIADPADRSVGPPAPARRCEARWTTLALAGLADLEHIPAEAVDRELAPGLCVCASDLLHVGEPVRIDGELDVVAGADAFAVPEHREVPGSVDVFDNAGDVCVLSISDVKDSLPPTHEEVGLPRWSVGFGVVWDFRHERLSHAQPSYA